VRAEGESVALDHFARDRAEIEGALASMHEALR